MRKSSINHDVKKSHLAQLIMLAQVDNKIDPHEAIFIKTLALKMRISEKEFNEILAAPENVEQLKAWEDNSNLRRYYETLLLMNIDSNTEPAEKEFCRELGVKLGIEMKHTENIVDYFSENVEKQITFEEIIQVKNSEMNG